MLEKYFHLKENGTDVKTEVISGLTIFVTMAYILAVNPNILGVVMDRNGVFMATAISSAIATVLMGIIANYPIALAPGMGMNAYFAYTVCLGELGGTPDAFTIALTAVLIEGILFIILSMVKVRESIVNGMSDNIKKGITAGIGLFIALIGLSGAGIMINDDSTLITMGSFSNPRMILAIVGLVIIVVLGHHRVRGSILIGILATWGLGIIAEVTGWYKVDIDAGVYSLFPDFSQGVNLGGLANTAFKFNFSWVFSHTIEFIAIIFSFLYVDLFDTIGSVVGIGRKANLVDENGELPRVGKVLLVDAIGTTVGACLGTSTVSSYIESSAGIAEGGRTGLSAIVTGFMFIAAIILSPVFLAIPTFATAPALIYVGMLMLTSVKEMDFEKDAADALAGYLAVVITPLTYSVANGIMFAVLSWVLVKLFTGKAKDVTPVMWGVFVLFILRIISLVS